jgi:hypothetical protein
MCAGAVDETYIPILAPNKNHTDYVNRKGFNSVLKAVFQSSHKAPRNSLRVMHEHFHPITMLNS